MSDAIAVLLVGIVGSDLLMTHLLGACPVIAVSRKLETAVGLAIAIIVVTPGAFLIGALVVAVLPTSVTPANGALPAIVLANLLAIYASGYAARAKFPRLYDSIEPFIPLLSVNCVLLGVVLLSLAADGPLWSRFLFAVGLAIGYGLFLIVFAEIRERITFADVPEPFRDAPIAILAMGILSLALFGLGL